MNTGSVCRRSATRWFWRLSQHSHLQRCHQGRTGRWLNDQCESCHGSQATLHICEILPQLTSEVCYKMKNRQHIFWRIEFSFAICLVFYILQVCWNGLALIYLFINWKHPGLFHSAGCVRSAAWLCSGKLPLAFTTKCAQPSRTMCGPMHWRCSMSVTGAAVLESCWNILQRWW